MSRTGGWLQPGLRVRREKTGAPCRASEEGCLTACVLLTSGQYSVCPRRLAGSGCSSSPMSPRMPRREGGGRQRVPVCWKPCSPPSSLLSLLPPRRWLGLGWADTYSSAGESGLGAPLGLSRLIGQSRALCALAACAAPLSCPQGAC